MRRFVTPADINGTGSVTTWNPARGSRPDSGPTSSAGSSSPAISARPDRRRDQHQLHVHRRCTRSLPPTAHLGAIYFPPALPSTPSTPAARHHAPAGPRRRLRPTLPDVTNNPFHGFESFRFPNQAYDRQSQRLPTASVTNPQQQRRRLVHDPRPSAALPVDYCRQRRQHARPRRSRPTTTRSIAAVHSDGLNEADEMNLYSPNPLLDSPFGPSDLEWLYRQQDVDGAIADQPAVAARADQLHQHDRRPAAAPALRARYLGD